ncbi:transglutaminase domain-containing protein [Halarcobacter sp.]|uniref:transglutaminase domain-containing protein n=1 Tax=Halarcobacter sp. TaxID=2321133 RepID=UPI003A92A968
MIINKKSYLEESEIIDFTNKSIKALAQELSFNTSSKEEIVKNCFEYVRDEIKHSGDYKIDKVTCKASEVLESKTGWCFAKAHLLAALLRANSIPTAFCYQRLSCEEYKENLFSLHGLNAVYLEKFGWLKIDARGNKKEVDAQFIPPKEKLAFELNENEFDLGVYYSNPLDIVIKALKVNSSYKQMIDNMPDFKSTI